ncbi:hypothetical protein EIP91_003111 [Steccherinum ochraceum]|uniref:Ribosome assembly protein 3 n=1 Tax=Steccherinum ochraceum TaxID=92696 RepID=A0A4R0S2H3_9APHY|nr:hypothetical protein EIP91_003111 [Steccherinum ochraceum]
MAPPPAKPPAARKRNRKRKRRVASSSESSSSSDSDSDSSSGPSQVAARKPQAPSSPAIEKSGSDADEESSSSYSSSSEDSSDPEDDTGAAAKQSAPAAGPSVPKDARMRSPSPEPPRPGSIPIPPFLPDSGNPEDDTRKEQELKEKFRKFWMTTIVDAFSDDLNELRKEPNMNPSRVALLIDSLASGAEVFSSSARPGTDDINEMEVVLEHAEQT